MMIPATVLHQMRTCVGVGALLAGGCDLAQASEDADAPQTAAPTVAARVVQELPAAPPKGLASKVATAVDEAKTRDADPDDAREPATPPEQTAPELEPLAGFAAPASPPEDVTEFVPFAAPSSALPAPKPRPHVKRKVAHIAASETSPVVTSPGWGADPCPPCGRG